MSIRRTLGLLRRDLAHERLRRKYRDATMLPPARFRDNLRTTVRYLPAGDIVECGCWRGGMSAALAEALPGRRSILFDSFEGLPPAGQNDGVRAHEFLAEGNTLVADREIAERAMRRTGQRYEIFQGWFDETIPKYAATEPTISVLRLDGDWYESTMTALDNLFPQVVPDGIVLIDDYEDWEGCTRAVHDYLSREQRVEPIRRSARANVAYLVKRRGDGHVDAVRGDVGPTCWWMKPTTSMRRIYRAIVPRGSAMDRLTIDAWQTPGYV